MNTTPDDEVEKESWLQLQRSRNRVNSQRTRNREREQIEDLNNERTSLSLANSALKYQNQHLRQAIRDIRNHMSSIQAGFQNAALHPPVIPPAVMVPSHNPIVPAVFQSGGTMQPPGMMQPPGTIRTPPTVASQLPALEQQLIQQILSQLQKPR
ncbi:unnamed protein product [Cylindrotheca closterium]|uniref:BZIP domain-containing protein n=1 Tax=Cylindrotheca closterium TaxID=2856 RepID=A0AAD2G0M0_9STRA|nr:unnamed protein product [Cylindrotheca closterium]